MPETTNALELTLAGVGLIATYYVFINYYNASSDARFVAREKINGEIHAATRDALRWARVLTIFALALDVIIGVAIFSYDAANERQNDAQRAATAISIMSLYGATFYAAIAERQSRVNSIKSFQLPGESRRDALLRAKQRLRRATDVRTEPCNDVPANNQAPTD